MKKTAERQRGLTLPDPRKCHVKRTLVHPEHVCKDSSKGYLFLLNEILHPATGPEPRAKLAKKNRAENKPPPAIIFLHCLEMPVYCPYRRPFARICFCTNPFFQ